MWNTGNIDERQEAALRLFGALSGVSEDYLASCEADAGVRDASGRGGAFSGTEEGSGGSVAAVRGMERFIWKYGRIMAAVLCVAVLGVSYLSFQLGVFSKGVKEYSGGTPENRENMAALTAYDSAAYDTATCEGAAEEEMSAAAVAGDVLPSEREAGVVTEAAVDDLNSVPSGGSGYAEKDLEIDKAEFAKENQIDQAVEESLTDRAGMLSSAQDERRVMKLEEAQNLSVVGRYLPAVWPGDGRIESMRGCDTQGQESVSLTWTYGNGWDSFFLTVTNLGDALPLWVQETVADPSRPETYDRRMYEIPYADTVPEEYRMVFQAPVFREKDFGKECVEARVLANAGDSGDTDTPGGHFCVLYQTDEGGYVLVNFNGRGSVDEIWNMMRSIQRDTAYEE